jgi:hypothetical protein
MGVGLFRQQPRVFGHACQLMGASVALETLAFRFDGKLDEPDRARFEQMKQIGWWCTAAACAGGLTVLTSLVLAKALRYTLPAGIGTGMLAFAGAIHAHGEQSHCGDPYTRKIQVKKLDAFVSSEYLETVKADTITLEAWKALKELPNLKKLRVLHVQANLLDPPPHLQTFIVRTLRIGGENKLNDLSSLSAIKLEEPEAGWHEPLVDLTNIDRIVLKECSHVVREDVQAILDGKHERLKTIEFYGDDVEKFKGLEKEDLLAFVDQKTAVGQRIQKNGKVDEDLSVKVIEDPSENWVGQLGDLSDLGRIVLCKEVTLESVQQFVEGDWGSVHTLELRQKIEGLDSICPDGYHVVPAKKEVPAKLHILNR